MISLRRAVVLGALQGPCELLPISSSGHLTLIPWLLGHDPEDADPELRKALEVALHAGTAAALVLVLRADVGEALRELTMRRINLIALSFVPPAVIGYGLERPIERRLGTPVTIAGGLLAGSGAMLVADRRAQRRSHQEADWLDALWLGLVQASALVPGVSRNGATLAAARFRGFRRRDAERLSRHVALPVIVGATLLKGVRLRRRGIPAGTARALGAGAGAAWGSTLIASRLLGGAERDRPLWPFALYRSALAAVVLVRAHRRRAHRQPDTLASGRGRSGMSAAAPPRARV